MVSLFERNVHFASLFVFQMGKKQADMTHHIGLTMRIVGCLLAIHLGIQLVFGPQQVLPQVVLQEALQQHPP